MGRGFEAKPLEHNLLALQRALGNSATRELLSSEPIRPKLLIGPPNDRYEREADRVAASIVAAAASGEETTMAADEGQRAAPSHRPQRSGTEDGLQGHERQQRSEHDAEAERAGENLARREPIAAPRAALGDGSLLKGLRTGGQALPPASRSFFEPRFRSDLTGVRIHTGARAAEAAESIRARAFTVGRDIVFGAGEYAPDSAPGRRLLAHELTHVLQRQSPRWPAAATTDPSASRRPPTPGPRLPAPRVARALADDLNYDRIADRIHKAIAGPGTDEEAVYLALQLLEGDAEAIRRLKERYRDKHGESLEAAIRGDFSGSELEYALQLLGMGTKAAPQRIGAAPTTAEQWKAAAKRIRAAVEGAGTDEEAVFAVLRPFGRDPKKVQRLKDVYRAEYDEEDLRQRLVSEMSGSELDYALYLMGEGPQGMAAKFAVHAAEGVLRYIKTEAAKRAKTPPSIDPGSKFYKVLKSKYLEEYFTKPEKKTGEEAVEKIGAQITGRRSKVDPKKVEVSPEPGKWRPAKGRWERNAVLVWNQQKLPTLPKEVTDLALFKNIKTLPPQTGAATGVLLEENLKVLPYIDVPFLLGKPRKERDSLVVDVVFGGKNLSQLMHWATGVKYSGESPAAMRELFLAYEMWHLEGWDVFGQDALNDLIAEEQGRLLGAELRKGKGGRLKSEADLLPFLDRSFREARAWVGALLRLRRAELEAWTLAETEAPAKMWWGALRERKLWRSPTVMEMLAAGKSLEEIKKSSFVQSQIEIYTLIYEADEWEKNVGPIEVTPLQKALVEGRLDKILAVMAKGGKAGVSELAGAKSQLDELKEGK